jgi:acetyl-CoA decarbonylase/synthase complex subunit beta/acetyl-CoA synthase
MTDVELAKKNGEDRLKVAISAINHNFAYEDTAYHLPISYALTGIPVHDRTAALEVFERTNFNPIVASESLLAEKTAAFLLPDSSAIQL